MALDLKLDIQTTDDCRNLVIEDITGSYSENNPGGWGGFNIFGNREEFNLQVHLTVYHFIDGVQYNTPMTVPGLGNLINYPSEDTYQGFKVSLPSYDISTELSSLIESIPESFDPMWDTVEDNIYKITVELSKSLTEVFQFDFVFTNVCNTEKKVNKLVSSVALNCEDCDDADIEKSLLAKSLLENLKEIK